MASVLLARDAELDRPVAIKLLADNLADDESFRRRFVREARLAARLSHPNIVKVYDAGEDSGRPYIVMELVDGETLADVVASRGRLPPAEAVDLALQICAGLEHAHAAGLVHRDVKPQNLLVRPDGVVKIADFGIARAAEATRLTQVGTILGTVAYLAPEQAAGEEVTAAADLYSLGAVLYEVLTGGTPYRSDSLAEVARRQESGEIEPIRDRAPEVPEPLEDAVMRCLARNPLYRPRSAAELARELAEAVPEAPTEPLPRRASPPARTRPLPTRSAPRRRRLGLWLVGGLGALLLGASAGLVAIADRGEGDGERPPPAVSPVPRGDTPAEQARSYAEWLRENATGPG
jgi:serine/threonine-protein kinase